MSSGKRSPTMIHLRVLLNKDIDTAWSDTFFNNFPDIDEQDKFISHRF